MLQNILSRERGNFESCPRSNKFGLSKIVDFGQFFLAFLNLLEIKMNIDRISRKWFKLSVNIFNKEDKNIVDLQGVTLMRVFLLGQKLHENFTQSQITR